MYNKYAETGRVKFIHNQSEDATEEEKSQWLDLPTPRGLGLILSSIKTEYKFVRLRDNFTRPQTDFHSSLWNFRIESLCYTSCSSHPQPSQHRSRRKPGFFQRNIDDLQPNAQRTLPSMTTERQRSLFSSHSWLKSFKRRSSYSRNGRRSIPRRRISLSRLLRS